jgi:hypothetical protein
LIFCAAINKEKLMSLQNPEAINPSPVNEPEQQQAPPEQRLATYWPSGMIKHVSATAVLAELGQPGPWANPDTKRDFDTPSSPSEQRHADILAQSLRLNSNDIYVLDRPVRPVNNRAIRRSQSVLPPGNRIVVAELPIKRAA